MQVSVEATGGLERRMTVEVPKERIEKEVRERLQRLARTTRLKGFRPGKVPLKEVARRYGNEVRMEVIGELMQSTFYQAVAQEKLQPAGAPQIEPKSLDEGSDISYTATFEVMPEIELASFEGTKLEKTVAEVTDADVDKMLETLCKQRAEWTEADRAAQEEDRVTIDFKGTIDGEDFKGNEGKSVPVTIGSQRMIAGFEDGLVGAKAGDELTLDLTFPEDYAYKEVAGKPVQFVVKVHKVEESKLPEVDEEFAKGFGITDGGVEALRGEIRQNMERELEQAVKAKIKQQVMDKLLELNEIEVPKALIDHEAEVLAGQMRQQMHVPAGKQGPAIDASMFQDQARRRVTLGLLLSELIRKNELSVDEGKVREAVEKIAASYDHPDEVVKWYYADRKRLSEVESVVLEDIAVEWVLGQAEVSEVKSDFDAVMNRG